MGKAQWAFFLQDSYKVTRKLSIDYGLRYDLPTAPHEQYGRSGNLGNGANPNAGGRNGIAIFEQTCNCNFYNTYKLALGPRFGFAYNLDSKTVIRGGWGLAFSFAADPAQNASSNLASSPSGTNSFVQLSSPTVLPQPIWPNFSPAQTPLPGQIVGYNGFTSIDANANRPPR